MTEQRRKTIVYGILVVALVYGAYNFMGKKAAPPAQIPTITALEGTAAMTTAVPDSTIDRLRTLPWGYDPFRSGGEARPAVRAEKTEVSPAGLAYVLTGVLQHPTHPLAYINGKMAGVGDKVDGATVVTIDKDHVIVDIQGQRRTLTLSKG